MPRHVVVTGAASGIGKAVTRQLVDRGCDCLALDKNEVVLERSHTPTATGRLLGAICDVTKPSDVEHALRSAEQAHGPISGVVHAAGILLAKNLLDENLTPDDLQQVLHVNVEGSWIVARAVARRLVAQRRGSIVLISSNAGTTPRLGMGPYCVSKAGVTMLARCLALELGRFNVRCNVVSPGSTDTNMLRGLAGEEGLERAVTGNLAQFRLGIPLGRVASADDVAHASLFLLSEASRHVTGWDLRVDGGATWS